MMKMIPTFLLFFVIFFACALPATNRGMTFLAGLNLYQAGMERLEVAPDRWPDRQRLAESLKTTSVVTIGGSKEFNRLVDLDLRRREFMITLRDPTLRAERAQEMKEELVKINGEIDALIGVIKGQVAVAELRSLEGPQKIESVATLGLLNLAMDAFSLARPAGGSSAPSTKVGPYVVADQGNFSTVRTPEGHAFRCLTSIQEEGASIKCEPLGAK